MPNTDKEQYPVKAVYAPCGSTLAKLLRDIILSADLEAAEEDGPAQEA